MAYLGRNDCFIHVPKTGGTYIRKVLQQKRNRTEVGAHHGLPVKWDYSENMFYWACVRHPAYWFRSIWKNRQNEKFKEFPHAAVPWAEFCRVIDPLLTTSFEESAMVVTMEAPGILTWLMAMYAAPPVKVIRLEDVEQYLESGGYNAKIGKVNEGGNLPGIPDYVFSMIFHAEIELYQKYAYNRRNYDEYLYEDTFT